MEESNVNFLLFCLPFSCNELAGTTNFLDSLLCKLREFFGTHETCNLWKLSLSENLKEAMLGNVNNSSLFFCGRITGCLTDKGPEFVEVDHLLIESVLLPVIVFHSFLSVVARMVFLHHDSFVMHTTGITSTTWVFSVSADSTVSVGYMTPHMSRLPLR